MVVLDNQSLWLRLVICYGWGNGLVGGDFPMGREGNVTTNVFHFFSFFPGYQQCV